MINNVVLVGRLTKGVSLRYTQSGIAVANFLLACERSFRNADGEKETDFISCVIWRGAAESLEKYTAKGSLIGVEGSIQTRNYENDQGQRVYVTEVLVSNFSLLEPKEVTEKRRMGTGQSTGGYQASNTGTAPGWTSQPHQSNFRPTEEIQIKDDDLPF